MKCVACQQPMIVLELDRIEIDYCLDCRGVWLDAGELELLLENKDEVAEVLKTAADAGQPGGSGRKCPICLKRMEEVAIGTAPVIHIDRCRRGHGLWFDRGELKEIMAMLGGFAGGKVAGLLQDIFGEKKA